MRRAAIIGSVMAVVAAVGMGAPIVAHPEPAPPTPSPKKRRGRHISARIRLQGGGSLAGRPHEHKREIARRLRQYERDAEKRLARAEDSDGLFGCMADCGVSRRGRVVWS